MNNYPDEWIQSFPEQWWVQDAQKTLCRGALIRTFVHFYEQIPLALLKSRADNNNHTSFELTAIPVNATRRIAKSETENMPVAAIPPLHDADCHLITRSKRRPCLILGGATPINPGRIRHLASRLKNSYFIVAPYYTATDRQRSTIPPEFRDNILCGKYKHLMLDHLPHESGHESFLRFDQCQPVGHQNASYEHLGFRLSDEALEILDEWINWYVFDYLNPEGDLSGFRDMWKSV